MLAGARHQLLYPPRVTEPQRRVSEAVIERPGASAAVRTGTTHRDRMRHGRRRHWVPMVVLAHGFGCDQHLWRLVTPVLEREHTVVLFDHVGSGRSDLSPWDAERYSTMDGYADDVLEVRRATGLGPVVFVGHSVSAMMGVLAAAREPGLFAGLVLLAPSPCFIDGERGSESGREQPHTGGDGEWPQQTQTPCRSNEPAQDDHPHRRAERVDGKKQSNAQRSSADLVRVGHHEPRRRDVQAGHTRQRQQRRELAVCPHHTDAVAHRPPHRCRSRDGILAVAGRSATTALITTADSPKVTASASRAPVVPSQVTTRAPRG